MGYFQAVTIDIDGTLTLGGRLSDQAVDAIDRVRQAGIRVILATGRIQSELEAEFSELAGHVDVLVAENGSVMVFGGRMQILVPPVDPALGNALSARDVPHRWGAATVALDGSHTTTAAAAIAELGLDCQIVHNRGAMMVLPSGVTKGTGLDFALRQMKLSPHNVIAIGDAENDVPLMSTAEIGVAVANALPSVKQHADLVLEQTDGCGVAELLGGPYLSGARRWCPPRRWITVGVGEDGQHEERDRANVFDIELLAQRLVDVTEWLTSQAATSALPIGFFGASTGGGAALAAAADPRVEVAAVVSRGGRPDMAEESLGLVHAPTLLIVGGSDEVVLELNRQAQAAMSAECTLSVVPGATHLFEEPGALERVAELARDWFVSHMAARR